MGKKVWWQVDKDPEETKDRKSLWDEINKKVEKQREEAKRKKQQEEEQKKKTK